MKILYCSVEVEPFAKVGGLADVAGSLPQALTTLGHDVRVLMPAYGMAVKDPGSARPVGEQFGVSLSPSQSVIATLYESIGGRVPTWFIEGDGYFSDIQDSTDVYTPGRDAYLFFAKSVARIADHTGWMPDVVHCNDWHTGFVAPCLREQRPDFDHTALIYTIHNLAYQGVFGKETLEAVGLPDWLFNFEQLETYGAVNFIKSACVYSDITNTVSQNYAREIQTPEYGFGLEGLMAHLAKEGRLKGILNGIDVDLNDPATDGRITSNYSVADLSGKAECRRFLCHELGLDVPEDKPLFAMVTRLSEQKGFNLIDSVSDQLMATGAGFVVLGIGDPWAASLLRGLEAKYPGRAKFVEGYRADLAPKIYAGADAFLMPSAFEPCGLGQMFAMRYGTVPVARRTGGLADTVFDGVNGFVFENQNPGDLLDAIQRTVRTFADKAAWGTLVKHGMEQDFSWSKSAGAYAAMYAEAAHMRRSDMLAGVL